MADFQQNFLNSVQSGLNIGQQVRAVQDRNRLNQLASQSYSTAPDQRQALLGQIAQVDANAARQQETAFATGDERRNTTLVNMARLLTSAPDQARPGLYAQMLPTLSTFGMSELPQEYNAETAPIINQAAQSIASAYGGGSGNGVQSTYINAGGQRVAVMRDGSQQVLGDADARTQLRDQAGVAPSIVNLRTGTATPLQEGAPIPAQGANGAYTIDPSLPPEVQSQIRAAESAGVEYNGQPVPSGLTATRPDNSQAITPYQQAQLARQDRADARAEAAAQGAREARDQAAQARQAAAQQKAQVAQQNLTTREARLNDVKRGAARVEAALKAYKDSWQSTGSGLPGSSALSSTPLGQELQAAVEGMKDSMLALTRVPGVGSQSDYEARIAGMRYPQPGQYAGTNDNSMKMLREFVDDLTGGAERANKEDRQSLESSASDSSQAPSAPSPGTIRNGYRFRGGNPADRNSWEKL